MRTLTSLRTAALASAAILSAAILVSCASAGGRTEGPTVPVDVVVNNNLTIPADLTVYAVTRGGNRTLLGGVLPQKTATFTFKPVSFSEPYRLLATRARGRDIRSQMFTVISDMTGKIIWTLVPNIVGFEDVETDSAGTSP
jgi:hypothetical protein